MEVKDENFITIQGWMVSQLELKGNELMVYAIIYGFTQDGESIYKGGLQYLANWTNSTKQGITNNLKSLVEKGYIEKIEETINNVKFANYRIVPLEDISKFNGIKKSLIPIKKSLINNIINNIDNNSLDKSKQLLSLEKNTKKSLLKNTSSSEKKKTKKEILYDNLINNTLVKFNLSYDKQINELLVKWLKGLYQVNKLPSETSLEQSLIELSNYSKEAIIEAIEVSIRNDYRTFYPKEKENISIDGINKSIRISNEEIAKQNNSSDLIKNLFGNNKIG